MTNISSPYSTGGKGPHFEVHIQASFVLLMLTGGYAPCLTQSWPIIEVKPQGRIDGFKTDDVVVIIEKPKSKERRKLLCQVKNSVQFIKSNKKLQEVFNAAWNDYHNPEIFNKGKDKIALITGPLSAIDTKNVTWILDQAKHTKNCDEFFHHIRTAKFSPSKCIDKLEVIQYCLRIANNGKDVSGNDLYLFLNDFHWIGYDLGGQHGVILSLLKSHISQFWCESPDSVWCQIVEVTQSWNHNAGTIIRDRLPEHLLEIFKPREIVSIPQSLIEVNKNDEFIFPREFSKHYLALANLIGGWSENNQGDKEIIVKFLEIEYPQWISSIRILINQKNSPIRVKGGIWKFTDRFRTLEKFGNELIASDIKKLQTIYFTVLTEQEPAIKIPNKDKYTFFRTGNKLKYSEIIKKNLLEGLALINNNKVLLPEIPRGSIDDLACSTIDKLLIDADWLKLVNLDCHLPTLAEVHPNRFISAIELLLNKVDSPFNHLFANEDTYQIKPYQVGGLFSSLEVLAWDKDYLVRICIILSKICNLKPKDFAESQAFRSLVSILLPWMPQTLASIAKRKVAVKSIIEMMPEVGWELLVKLLPGFHQTSFGTQKPFWFLSLPEKKGTGVSHNEYWKQISFYSNLAFELSTDNNHRILILLDFIDRFPEEEFNELIAILDLIKSKGYSDEEVFPLWDKLRSIINRNERYKNEKGSLNKNRERALKNILNSLEPKNPIFKFQYLFNDDYFQLQVMRGTDDIKGPEILKKREAAIKEIFNQSGFEGILRFSDDIPFCDRVGEALCNAGINEVEDKLIPTFLSPKKNKYFNLIIGYSKRKFELKGWKWFDNLNKDKWKKTEVGRLLSILPFSNECWDRVEYILGDLEFEYWSIVKPRPFQMDKKIDYAAEKFLKYNRPIYAIECLSVILSRKKSPNLKLCIKALLKTAENIEKYAFYYELEILELINFLQSEPNVKQKDLIQIEMAYLPSLVKSNIHLPKALYNKMANDPEYFCYITKLCFRPKFEEEEPKKIDREMAKKSWLLFENWQTVPGTNSEKNFDAKRFTIWFTFVKEECKKSGHLDSAFLQIGKVLIYSPADPDGLWIHKAIARELNNPNAEKLRNAYYTSTYNSRGIHRADPSGDAEMKLARKFQGFANEVEDAGFPLFAGTLRGLSETYKRQAMKMDDYNYDD